MNALTFDQKIESQIDLSKNGIFEVFVNEGELIEYWRLDGNKNQI
ncbi:hypothetical protein OWR28_02505 [Chryseobacterium sp. 1B4]